MNKKSAILLVTVMVAISMLTFFWFDTSKFDESTPASTELSSEIEKADLEKAKKLLSEDKTDEALNVIQNYEDRISLRPGYGLEWLNLLIEVNMKLLNFQKLTQLYEIFPKAFEDNEKGSLMVADGYILSKEPQKYAEIREVWRDKATILETWTVLDADRLLLEGKNENAQKLLESHKFEGKKDVDRLIRLALMLIVTHPDTAWKHLNEALALDPSNTSIMSYQGKILEVFGKNSLALYEYLVAIQNEPNNLFLLDQLAEFYFRHGQVPMALSVWLGTLSKPSLDSIWLKILFWSKTIMPVNFEWREASPPIGPYKELIEYLASLPSGVFWDENKFKGLSKANYFLSDVQLTFWLRLLQLLNDGHEKEALELLRFNKFANFSLNPALEKGLKQILNYRLSGFLVEETNPSSDSAKEKKEQIFQALALNEALKEDELGKDAFFSRLNYAESEQKKEGKNFKLPNGMLEVVDSPEIFTVAALTANWFEAALQLHKLAVYPDGFPDWIAYDLTQAYRTNRSPAEALAFATKQKQTGSLKLLIGELYIADNKPNEGLEVLLPFMEEQSSNGDRAAYLVSLIYVDKKEYDKAKEIINAHPQLSSQLAGREALARIAVLQGKLDVADEIYNQIQEISPEAKSYLARIAYEKKDWRRAQELTQQLFEIFPDNPVIRENLFKIEAAQRSQVK